MLSVNEIQDSRAARAYYAKLSVEDYYQAGTDRPGYWFGGGSAIMGVQAEAVSPEQIQNLFDGWSPDRKEALVQNAIWRPGDDWKLGELSDRPKSRNLGWDLTFSAPKSVSVVWSQLEGENAAYIERVQRESVHTALKWLEDSGVYSRTGKRGATKQAAKITAALFEHYTSRAQDPQIHTHALVMNIAHRVDGYTGALESHGLFVNQKIAGALYRLELATGLKKLGFDIERTGNAFKISSIGQDLIDEFSKRRAAIEEALALTGGKGAALSEKLALATREKKESLPLEGLRKEWQRVGEQYGWTKGSMEELFRPEGHSRRITTPEEIFQQAIAELTETEAVFSYRQLVLTTAVVAVDQGITTGDLLKLVHSQSKALVSLNPGVALGKRRFSTKEILDRELKLETHLYESRKDDCRRISRDSIDRVLQTKAYGHLSKEQRAAVCHVIETRGSIAALIGRPGSGKSSVMRPTKDIYESKGFHVLGAAPSAKAARSLHEGSGIESSTIHKLLIDIERGSVKLDDKTVVILDEAGMVGTDNMLKIVQHVRRSSSRLIMVGDQQQLAPYDAGSPFRRAVEPRLLGAAELTENYRQANSQWKGVIEANDLVRAGKAVEALKMYREAGALLVEKESRTDTMLRALKDWSMNIDRNELLSGSEKALDSAIIAARREEIRRFNELAQAELDAKGFLGGESLYANGYHFRTGDLVRFRQNVSSERVANGMVGRIDSIDKASRKLSVSILEKVDSEYQVKQRVEVSLGVYKSIELGYASTVYGSQGATYDSHAFVLDSGMQRDRESAYVALTRAKQMTKLYSDAELAGENNQALAKRISAARGKENAIDVLRAARAEERMEMDW